MVASLFDLGSGRLGAVLAVGVAAPATRGGRDRGPLSPGDVLVVDPGAPLGHGDTVLVADGDAVAVGTLVCRRGRPSVVVDGRERRLVPPLGLVGRATTLFRDVSRPAAPAGAVSPVGRVVGVHRDR